MALTLSIDDAVPLSADAADLAGSPQRFHAVVDRHFDAVAAYLARRVGPDTAEDLAQEVFVTAFRKRHRFDASFGSARPWLLGIANKRSRDIAAPSSVSSSSTGAWLPSRSHAQWSATTSIPTCTPDWRRSS